MRCMVVGLVIVIILRLIRLRLLVGFRAFVRLTVWQGFATRHLPKAGLPLSPVHQAIRLRRGVSASG